MNSSSTAMLPCRPTAPNRARTSWSSHHSRYSSPLAVPSPGIGDNVLFFVGVAQEVVLVLSPEPTSLVDAYAVVKVLSQQAGIRNFAVVINPVVDEMPARDMFQKLSSVTGRFLTAKLRHLGYVPRDENVHRAVMAQRPVVDLFPMAPASRALADVAERLFSEPAPQILEGGMKVMWQRLMREAESPR
jgi:flagellar biosynthesis protein FlhG